MTKQINNDQMANVRRSLAEAGIYFDKLYINQAYFNSQITVHEPKKKHPKTIPTVWKKLLCASKTQQTSALTVRDDRHEHIYDRRQYHSSTQVATHDNRLPRVSLPVRRRPPSMASRSVPQSLGKEIIADVDDEFVV